MEAVLMLLGFNRAVSRFMGYEPTDLGAAMRTVLDNPDHPDHRDLLRSEFQSQKTDEDDLDEKLLTVERYLALFEALNWGVSLDDRLTRDWPFDEIQFGKYWCDDFAGAGLIRGLRHARNAVHHDWSLALDVNPFEVLFQQRMELLWLCWSSDLDSKRPNPDGERAYRENLAGRVVGDTLLEIGALFEAGTNLAMGQIPRQQEGPARVKTSPDDRYEPDEES
jgi:hypothetical protein